MQAPRLRRERRECHCRHEIRPARRIIPKYRAMLDQENQLPKLFRVGALACAVLAFAATAASAQSWPERRVTLIVGYAAGGVTDLLGRLAAERLEARLKQPFIVENVLGATGTLAAQRVARSQPDGYTLFVGSVAQFTVSPHMQTIAYDPIKDFQPISIIATAPFVITINTKTPVNTLPELIAYVKAKPGLSYGSGGVGSLAHMAGAMFTKAAGLDMGHVPYRGISLAFQDLIAGHHTMMAATTVELKPFLEGANLKPLAVTDNKRSSVVPAVPAITDYMPFHSVITWNGLLAPTGTPQAVIDTVSSEMMAAGRDPAFLEKLNKLGVDPVVHKPEDFARIIKDELQSWGAIIKELNLAPPK